MRLLVAEDDPKLLKSLIHIFASNKFSVDGVSNGKDALLYGQTKEYDGLVLDIMMPGLDGLQVLRELRQAGITTPILILGYTPVERADSLLDNGITQTVYDVNMARALSDAAAAAGKTLKIHVKADTGMSRLGWLCGDEDQSAAVEAIAQVSFSRASLLHKRPALLHRPS